MGLDKGIARTFFNRHSPVIHQQFAEFIRENGRYPSPEDFIIILDSIIQNRALPIASNIRVAMTTDNMHSGQKFIEKELETLKEDFGPLRPASPPPAPTPAPSSSEPEFAGAYFADDGMGDSKGRLIREQGMDAADASLAVNTTDISGTLRGVTSQGLYLHKTVKSSGGLGVKDKQHGGNKVTFIYQEGIRGFYLVGFAEHRKPKKGTASTYYVTQSFITALKERDTLTF